MAQFRERHLKKILGELVTFSPVIGVLGHRQVGKTSFLERGLGPYYTLDDENILFQAQNDTTNFILNLTKPLTVIDESQLSEKIFPAIKERVRKNKKPGQLILSGSVRFTSKKVIRESLTGRISNIDLLPLTLSELSEKSCSQMAHSLLRVKSLEHFENSLNILPKRLWSVRKKHISSYQDRGGLPGLCFFRNARVLRERAEDQLATILDRDLRQVYPTSLAYADIRRFVEVLSEFDLKTINYSEIQRRTKISPTIQKSLLYALESVFIIRLIPVEGDLGGMAIFFEDQFESKYLSRGTQDDEIQWAGLIYRNLREQSFYSLGCDWRYFQYKSRGGAFVPFAFHASEQSLGFICFRGEKPTRSQIFSGQSFLRKYSNSKIIYVGGEREALKIIDARSMILPAEILLFD